MNPWRNNADQWEAIRDLQEANRDLNKRVEAVEMMAARKAASRDWLLTKFVPALGTIAIAYAALDQIFHFS